MNVFLPKFLSLHNQKGVHYKGETILTSTSTYLILILGHILKSQFIKVKSLTSLFISLFYLTRIGIKIDMSPRFHNPKKRLGFFKKSKRITFFLSRKREKRITSCLLYFKCCKASNNFRISED